MVGVRILCVMLPPSVQNLLAGGYHEIAARTCRTLWPLQAFAREPVRRTPAPVALTSKRAE
jgi:hypothetical protein